MKNGVDTVTLAKRIASKSAERARPNYEVEVQALMDAALEVISNSPTGKARVAEIVEAAGLSNDAFYRHFPSKDALVAALIEEGAERFAEVLARRMDAEETAEAKLRRWLEGMVARARGSQANSLRSVLANTTNATSGIATGNHVARAPFAALLYQPFATLGSTQPEFDAELVTHAVLGRVTGHLYAGTRPSSEEFDRLFRFCLLAASAGRDSNTDDAWMLGGASA